MSLIETLNVARVDRAFCSTTDPEIWWSESTAGLARHYCLSHCPAQRACLKQAPKWAGGGCVAGGYQWVAIRPSALPTVKRSQVPPVSCNDCLRADGMPVAPFEPTSQRPGRPLGVAYTAEIRRLTALAAS